MNLMPNWPKSQPPKFLITHRLLLIGGSTAHIIFLKKWAKSRLAGVEVVLIDDSPVVPYSGSASGFIAQDITADWLDIDLVRLCRAAQARFIKAKLEKVAALTNTVELSTGLSLKYDFLALSLGLAAKKYKTQNSAIVYDLYPAKLFLSNLTALIAKLSTQNLRKISLIGYNQTTFELALCLDKRLKALDLPANKASFELKIITDRYKLFGQRPTRFRNYTKNMLQDRGIALLEDYAIDYIDKKFIATANNGKIASDINIICESEPEKCPGLTSGNSDILVDRQLRTKFATNIFATGSVTSQAGIKEPNSGVKSLNQGKILHYNLKASLTNRGLKKYRNRLTPLSIINTADNRGLLLKRGYFFHQKWCRGLKQLLDRRYIKRVARFKPMIMQNELKLAAPLKSTIAPELLADFKLPFCGGCGAKLAAKELQLAFRSLTTANESEIIWGIDHHEDISAVKFGAENLFQTCDFLKNFHQDPYIFAKITSLHALNDLFAKGISGGFAQLIVVLPYELRNYHQEYLTHLLAGVLSSLDEHGVKLVGGHSAEGAEFSIGLNLSARGEMKDLWSKAGAQEGDFLLLNKPLGSGILLKGAMLNLVSSQDYNQLEAVQLQSNQKAVAILKNYAVNAVTDLSGFGLVNHLEDMLAKSQKTGLLSTSALPVLSAVKPLLKQAVHSSLYRRNKNKRVLLSKAEDYLDPLLHDPQTSGGLLISLKAKDAAPCLLALKKAGYTQAAIIGKVLACSATEPANAPGKIKIGNIAI